METTASPLSDVYPTEIKAIMSTAQELNAQVFEPDFASQTIYCIALKVLFLVLASMNLMESLFSW